MCDADIKQAIELTIAFTLVSLMFLALFVAVVLDKPKGENNGQA